MECNLIKLALSRAHTDHSPPSIAQSSLRTIKCMCEGHWHVHACSSSTQVWTLTRVAGSILHQIVQTIFSFEQGWVPNEREAALSSSGGITVYKNVEKVNKLLT
jgi:hypothetical protein